MRKNGSEKKKKMNRENNYQLFPDECFWCGTTGWASGLEEHHLWRGSQRSLSPSVWLCNRDHRWATFDKDFEIKLQDIYLYQYENVRFKRGTIASYGSDRYNPRNYGRNGVDPARCCHPGASGGVGEQIEQ